MKGWPALALTTFAVLAISVGVWATRPPEGQTAIPVTPVQRGMVDVKVRTIGDIRASRTTQMFVPPAGGTLTIIGLASTGARLKAGEVVVEFDSADQVFALEQAQSDLALAEQEIVKAEAQAAVQAAEDDVSLLKARFAVRRAELDASGHEFVGALVAKQNVLLLEEARQKLAQLESDVSSRRTSSRAATNVLRERANKSRVAVGVAERNINNLVVTAPFEGYVTVRQNMNAMGGVVFSGAVMPDFRVGDSAFSGNVIADLVDTSRLEVTAKLSERDRANVEVGQPTTVAIDGLPGAVLDGKVRAVSSVASRRMFEAGGTRQFDIAFEILKAPPQVWPGTSGAITINGATFDEALHVPRSAVFDVAGTPTVYVRTATGFEPKTITVRAWTDTVAVIQDVDPAALVALIDPTKTNGATPPSGNRAPMGRPGVTP